MTSCSTKKKASNNIMKRINELRGTYTAGKGSNSHIRWSNQTERIEPECGGYTEASDRWRRMNGLCAGHVVDADDVFKSVQSRDESLKPYLAGICAIIICVFMGLLLKTHIDNWILFGLLSLYLYVTYRPEIHWTRWKYFQWQIWLT